MAKAQQPKRQKRIQKDTEVVIEAVKKEEETPLIPIPKIYCAFIYLELEPLQKNVHVADYIYTESTNKVSFFERNPRHSAALEGLMLGDLTVIDGSSGALTMISREQPLEWIKMLYKAKEFSGNPYVADIPIEYYETG